MQKKYKVKINNYEVEITQDVDGKFIIPFSNSHTALKPAHEPICMARKPLSEKTVAENVLKYGTGGVNIDGGRIGTETRINKGMSANKPSGAGTFRDDNWKPKDVENIAQGRFPANLIHDGSDEVVRGFPQTSGAGNKIGSPKKAGTFFSDDRTQINTKYDMGGSASRFFYCAKSSRKERLLNGFHCATIEECKDVNMEQVVSLVRAILDLATKSLSIGGYGGNTTEAYPKDTLSTIKTTISKITELKTWNLLIHSPTKEYIADVFLKKTDGISPVESAESSNEWMTKIGTLIEKVGYATEDVKNATLKSLLLLKEKDAWQDAYSHHPTHKPISLMRYLVKLVTPPQGIVLDPFTGSGSTLCAAVILGFRYIGIDKEEEYVKIAEARIKAWSQEPQQDRLL